MRAPACLAESTIRCSHVGICILKSFALTSLLVAGSIAVNGQNAADQAPKTAPQVQEILPSYEGQRVAAVEIAGQPGLDTQALQSLIVQSEDQPFSKAKIDQTVAALKSSGKAKEVEVEVRPQANGIRVMFVLQPAIYF